MTTAPADLSAFDVARVRADNPGLLTLSGTNTWVVGREPAHVIDPGPDLPEHVSAVAAEVAARGGLGGIALTHDHHDHDEAVEAVIRVCGDAPVAAAPREGARIGPLRVIATPGHTPTHVAYAFEAVIFTGDAVLGEGSVFISPDPGALAGYLGALDRLRALRPGILCPGHGPPISDPIAKLTEYINHRLDRERRLIAALDEGARTIAEMLDRAWSDVPEGLRLPAAITLAAHLDKLEDEGRLPAGVERPPWPLDAPPVV